MHCSESFWHPDLTQPCRRGMFLERIGYESKTDYGVNTQEREQIPACVFYFCWIFTFSRLQRNNFNNYTVLQDSQWVTLISSFSQLKSHSENHLLPVFRAISPESYLPVSPKHDPTAISWFVFQFSGLFWCFIDSLLWKLRT